MEDVSIRKNPKRKNTKKDKENMMPKTSFFSKMKQIIDTNISTVHMIWVKDILKEGQSPLEKKIYKSIIVHAISFCPTLPSPKFVLEWISRFDLTSRSIIFDEGKRVLVNIGRQEIQEKFNIPQYKNKIVVMMDQVAKSF